MTEPRRPRPFDEDWTEEDWEHFLRQTDVRSAKYDELFETLVDHPDRDALIAREMGWEEARDSDDCDDCDDCPHQSDCEVYGMNLAYQQPPEDEVEVEADPFDEVERVPAYRIAHEFTSRVHAALPLSPNTDEPDRDLVAARLAAVQIAAKIAGGHAIGYGRDELCGNIANCRRADQSAQDCLAALRRLQYRRVLPKQRVLELVRRGQEVRARVVEWIEELRSRIWWP